MYRADVLCWGECPLCSRNLCKIIFIYNENEDNLSLEVQRWNMAKSNPEWLVEASIKNAFHKYVRHGFGVCIDSFDTFHLRVHQVVQCRRYRLQWTRDRASVLSMRKICSTSSSGSFQNGSPALGEIFARRWNFFGNGSLSREERRHEGRRYRRGGRYRRRGIHRMCIYIYM